MEIGAKSGPGPGHESAGAAGDGTGGPPRGDAGRERGLGGVAAGRP
jgi:hypothetical protein